MYDSLRDTLTHISNVQSRMAEAIIDLLNRALTHDKSKTESPEKEVLDTLAPPWAAYGTAEYEAGKEKIKDALDHHYAHNSHHIEYYLDGIDGVNLLDLIEMVCDWKSKEADSPENNIIKSIEINSEKYGIKPQLKQILLNTASYMEWM